MIITFVSVDFHTDKGFAQGSLLEGCTKFAKVKNLNVIYEYPCIATLALLPYNMA